VRAAIRHFAELRFEPSKRAALAAMPFFQRGQFRAQHGMLFANPVRFLLGCVQLLAQRVEILFARDSLGVFLFHQGLIPSARFMGSFFFAAQPIQFETRG
jgi:hypothetical protein